MAEPLNAVAEAYVVQRAPGPPPTDLAIFDSDKVSVLGLSHHAATVGVMIIRPDCFSFMWWDGPDDCTINGERPDWNVLYAQGHQDGFHAAGGARRTTGIGVRRDDLTRTLAALRGVGPEDVQLDETSLRLTTQGAQRFRQDVDVLFQSALEGAQAAPDLGEAFFGLLVDAAMQATPERIRERRTRPPEQIVRLAEDRFAEAMGRPVSLADLCAAAGVSQSVLYRAFHSVCDEPPLVYFQKRRLSKARTTLVTSPPYRGAIKNAALSVGLTELGRFSVEYRRLFGETPSATLDRYPDA